MSGPTISNDIFIRRNSLELNPATGAKERTELTGLSRTHKNTSKENGVYQNQMSVEASDSPGWIHPENNVFSMLEANPSGSFGMSPSKQEMNRHVVATSDINVDAKSRQKKLEKQITELFSLETHAPPDRLCFDKFKTNPSHRVSRFYLREVNEQESVKNFSQLVGSIQQTVDPGFKKLQEQDSQEDMIPIPSGSTLTSVWIQQFAENSPYLPLLHHIYLEGVEENIGYEKLVQAGGEDFLQSQCSKLNLGIIFLEGNCGLCANFITKIMVDGGNYTYKNSMAVDEKTTLNFQELQDHLRLLNPASSYVLRVQDRPLGHAYVLFLPIQQFGEERRAFLYQSDFGEGVTQKLRLVDWMKHRGHESVELSKFIEYWENSENYHR
jgi:hypothetical protein